MFDRLWMIIMRPEYLEAHHFLPTVEEKTPSCLGETHLMWYLSVKAASQAFHYGHFFLSSHFTLWNYLGLFFVLFED